MESPKKSNGTQSETGQGSGTQAEVSTGVKIEDTAYFTSRTHGDGRSH